MKGFIKYTLGIFGFALFLSIIYSLTFTLAAPTTFTFAATSIANNSFITANWSWINFTSNEDLLNASCQIFHFNGSIQNKTLSNTSLTAWGVNISALVDSPVGKSYNFTCHSTNRTGTRATSDIYFFEIDSQAPTMSSHWVYGLYNTSGGNFIEVFQNMSDANTDACKFLIWYEVVTPAVNPQATTKTFVLGNTLAGTLVSTTTHEKNCSLNITWTDIEVAGKRGQFLIEGWSNDSVGRETKSLQNLTLVYNKLVAGYWTPLGHVEASRTLLQWAYKAYFMNISYVSVFNNTYGLHNFTTYRANYSASNTSIIDAGNVSGLYVYPAVNWGLIRYDSTSTANCWLYAANTTVNLTITPTGIKTPWNLVAMVYTNTTAAIANKSASITFVSWHNASDTRCPGGCYITHKKGWDFNANVTIYRGEAMWILTSTNGTTSNAGVALSR